MGSQAKGAHRLHAAGREPDTTGSPRPVAPFEALPWSLWSHAFARSPLPQCVVDGDGLVVAANTALASRCATEAVHLVGLPASDLFDLGAAAEQRLRSVGQGDLSFTGIEPGPEFDVPTGTGTLIATGLEAAGRGWILIQLVEVPLTPAAVAPSAAAAPALEAPSSDPDPEPEPEPAPAIAVPIDIRERRAAPPSDRAAQQAAIARLGEAALEGTPIVDLEQRAVATAGELLGADRTAIVELRTPGQSSLRASWRWSDPAGPGSADVLREALSAPSWLSAQIDDGNGASRLLVACADRPDTFTAGDHDFLHAAANVLASASRHARSAAEAEHRSMHDALTGLPNRSAFLGRLTASLAELRTRRRNPAPGGGAGVVGVLFVDIHDFSFLNATLGHDAADDVLRAVGHRVEESVSGGDVVARAGGDEFLVLVVADQADDVLAAARRLLAAFEEPITTPVQSLPLSACIGVALGVDGNERADDLVRDADAALHRAKSEGSAEVEVFTPEVGELARTRVETGHDLRAAVERGELVLHYQPVIDLNSGEVAGAEALVRWHHPRRGLLRPAEFIHIAEETGQIATLGGFVLQEACRQLEQWRIRQLVSASFRVSINVAPHQLARPEIVDVVQRALAESHIQPGSLSLEITESSLLRGVERSLEHAVLLKGLGVSLAIDDFGTGYSSLAQLRQLPVDTIKLDQSFVADLDAEASSVDLVSGVIALARSLDLDVVAEGAERASQVELLRSSGCRLGQGFVWCQPLPARQFEQWMAQHLGSLAAPASDLTV